MSKLLTHEVFRKAHDSLEVPIQWPRVLLEITWGKHVGQVCVSIQYKGGSVRRGQQYRQYTGGDMLHMSFGQRPESCQQLGANSGHVCESRQPPVHRVTHFGRGGLGVLGLLVWSSGCFVLVVLVVVVVWSLCSPRSWS